MTTVVFPGRSNAIAIWLLLLLAVPALAEEPIDFTLKSATDDSSFQLSQHRDKTVVLHFLLKTECPVCLRHTRAYARLAAQTPDVIHLFLKPDSETEIRSWFKNLSSEELQKLPVIYRDPDAMLAKRFQVPDGYAFHGQIVHYPALIALDGQGRELFRYVGKNNTDRMAPEDFMAKLKAVTRAPPR